MESPLVETSEQKNSEIKGKKSWFESQSWIYYLVIICVILVISYISYNSFSDNNSGFLGNTIKTDTGAKSVNSYIEDKIYDLEQQQNSNLSR